MHWIFYTILNNTSLVTKDFFVKKNAKIFGLLQFMATQNFFCSLITIFIGYLVVGNISFGSQIPLFALMAFLHSFAQTAKAKAMTINMSLTSVASNFTPIFSIILAFFFLQELAMFNPETIAGILRIVAIMIFPIVLFLLSNGKNTQKNQRTNLIWFLCIVAQVIGHGTANFMYKYYLNVENLWSFLIIQRFFVFIFSLVYLIPQKKFVFNDKILKPGLLTGALIVISTVADKIAIIKAPLSLYLILQKPLATIATSLVGLYIFKEKKVLDTKQWIGLGLGFILTLIIVLASIVK